MKPPQSSASWCRAGMARVGLASEWGGTLTVGYVGGSVTICHSRDLAGNAGLTGPPEASERRG